MYSDKRRHLHVINAGKYFSSIMVVVSSGVLVSFSSNHVFIAHHTTAMHVAIDAHQLVEWTPAKAHWVFWLVVKTLYCTVWDWTQDWSLFQSRAFDSRPFPIFLRPQRLYDYTFFYYFAIVSNFAMRCSWSIALSVNHVLLPDYWSPLMALVEIVRRSQWLVFRVENRHIELSNNDSDNAD